MSTQTTTIIDAAAKISVTASYNSILESKEILDAQATQYSIDIEKIACDDAIDALTTYLTSNPGWGVDATEDLVIDPAEYNAAFDSVFTAIRELQTTIAEAIAATPAADPVV